MILFLSKFLALLFYPVGLSILLLVVAGILGFFSKKKSALGCAFAGTAILLFFSMPIVANKLAGNLESKYVQQRSFKPAAAIVVLGGCTRPAVPPRVFNGIGAAGDRMVHAARLYNSGYAPYIVCTGGRIPFLSNNPTTEGETMASLLRDVWRVDSASVIVESEAQTTYDHGPKLRALFKQRNMKQNIILVTSAMHMERSVKIFKKFGFTVQPAPADIYVDHCKGELLFALLPSADALNTSTTALHEYYGILAYAIMGKL